MITEQDIKRIILDELNEIEITWYSNPYTSEYTDDEYEWVEMFMEHTMEDKVSLLIGELVSNDLCHVFDEIPVGKLYKTICEVVSDWENSH